MNTYSAFAILALIWNLAITIFWIYIGLQALSVARQLLSTLRRLATTQERIEKHLQGNATIQTSK